MDYSKLIENALKFSTDTKAFELGAGFLRKAPELFEKFFEGRNALIVSDKATWDVAGEKVYRYFTDAGIHTDRYIFEDSELHAEYEYTSRIDAEIERTGAIAVCVGSGVINDLCKYVSFQRGQQYMCVATAASMDGYASSGAVMTKDGAKVNIETHAPLVILADSEILAAAPVSLTAAGYADLAAKIPASAEWLIADAFGTEPIIPEAWNMLVPVLDEMLAHPAEVHAKDPDAVAALFAGLTISGIAMQYVKSSRPASCSEHLFSHYLDMNHHRHNGRLQSHGFQVAIGTLTSCAMFDELFKMDLSKLDVDACVAAWGSLEDEQNRAIEVYKDFPVPMLGYTEITKKYNDKETVRRQLTTVKENWQELKEKLQKVCYSFEKMKALFAAVGAPTDPEEIGVSRKQLRKMVDYVQLMRWRINLLDLAKRGCFYDTLVENVFGKGGAWEI